MAKKDVIIYTSEDCGACNTVKMYLDQNEVTYDERNVSKVEEYMEELSKLGFQSVPVTVGLGVEPFAGFELKELDEIIQQKKSQ